MKVASGILALVIGNSVVADPGPIERGEQLFNSRDKGHCLLCHALSKNDSPFQGNLGPSLDGVGKRLDKEELIARVKDSRAFNPNTIMPPYFSTKDLRQVQSAFQGETVLTEREITDLVAYLLEASHD